MIWRLRLVLLLCLLLFVCFVLLGRVFVCALYSILPISFSVFFCCFGVFRAYIDFLGIVLSCFVSPPSLFCGDGSMGLLIFCWPSAVVLVDVVIGLTFLCRGFHPLHLRELEEESRFGTFLFPCLPLGYCCQSRRRAPYPVVDPPFLSVFYLLAPSLAQGAFCVFCFVSLSGVDIVNCSSSWSLFVLGLRFFFVWVGWCVCCFMARLRCYLVGFSPFFGLFAFLFLDSGFWAFRRDGMSVSVFPYWNS